MNDDDNRLFKTKIKNLIPDEEQRTMMLITVMGMSALLTEYIMNNNDPKDLPVMVKYACAMTSANMIAFLSDGTKAQFKDLAQDEPYEMGEQTQERIYRKMKWVIEEMYKSLQENEQV